jgi:hypothetical protein
LEGQLHRHLASAREAISRCEQNERIVAADGAKINGDRAREEYGRARDAIDDEAEQHRRNELDIQEKLSAIRTTVGQIRAWQWSRPLIEPARSFPQRDYSRDFGGCPPWSKQSAERELDDLLRRPVGTGDLPGGRHRSFDESPQMERRAMFDVLAGTGGPNPTVKVLRAGQAEVTGLLTLPLGHSVYTLDVAPALSRASRILR